jgi:primosomal protein N'
LVSNIFNPQVEEKIKKGEIINDLIEERKINNLPPFKRLVILKEGSKDLKRLQEKLSLIKEKIKKENPEIEIFGPIFARPFKIKKRFFLELVLKIDPQLDFNLRKILKDIEIEEIDVDALSY